ncbi:MAG TPA: hypothetical protein VG097_01030 [Gemmata sp.]|jgi:hypothetical protein|nr:hypothetical protein [Gemmata sp.]
MISNRTRRWRELGGLWMSLRSWAIRGLILAGVAILATLVWFANSWISPERVRAQVIENLSAQFDNVDVHVGSARLRILGGIAVSDLKLTRRGSNGSTPFLSVPTAILYHDKEQLNRGQLVIKKIELENLELNLERSKEGKWNVSDIFKDSLADKPVPSFVIKDGTIHIVDRSPEGFPEMTLQTVQLTLLNDPIPEIKINASGSAKGYGPVSVVGKYERVTKKLEIKLDLLEVPIGETIARNADRFAPGLARHLAGLTATAAISDRVSYTLNASKPCQHNITVSIKGARYTHPDLPWPVENIAAEIRIPDGRFIVDKATAEIAGAKVKLTAESRVDEPAKLESIASASDDILKSIEDHLAKLELSIDGLTLDSVLYRVLPPKAQQKWQEFSPIGQVDLSYKFTRESPGWKREFELRPKQISIIYDKFKYPVADVRGWVKRTLTHLGEPVANIDLLATAGGQTISIKGQITGDGLDPGINLRVSGANVLIDEKLFAAFPPKYAEKVKQFKTTGRGDFVAEFVQAQGVNLCENEFRIDIRDANFRHMDFPYPLEKVKGRLVVRLSAMDPSRPVHPGDISGVHPEREEIILDGFTAVHAGATIALNGSKQPIPGTRDKKLILHFGGNNCPFDDDLKATCIGLKIGSIWNTFNPRGKLSFNADLELIDRASPIGQPNLESHIDPATDLKLTFTFAGANVTPTFFRYDFSDFAGWLEYKDGRVNLANLTARHGDSRIRVAQCETRFSPDGVVWANLLGLEVKPLIVDEAFIRALPGKLASGVEELRLKGKAELAVKQLVVRTPPDSPVNQNAAPGVPPILPVSSSLYPVQQVPGTTAAQTQPDPIVYWDLELKLMGASLDIGVAWDEVNGRVGCLGIYEGTHVGTILGNLSINRAAIAGQPVTGIQGRFGALEQRPDPTRNGEYYPVELQFKDLAGWLFNGTLGGEAHVMLSTPVRFNLWLKASDVQLEEVARHFKLGSDSLQGIAQAQLRLYNRTDPMTGQLILEGWGSIDVPTGRMYNLPILIDLLKLLKFETPNKTAFEEAHANFRILGDRVKVDQIDLIGRAVCLGGSGEFDTSGNYVKFDFYTIISQVLARLINDNTLVGDLTAFLSKNLFVYKLTRENGELKYKPVALPVVSEPAQAVANRLRARFAQMLGVK